MPYVIEINKNEWLSGTLHGPPVTKIFLDAFIYSDLEIAKFDVRNKGECAKGARVHEVICHIQKYDVA